MASMTISPTAVGIAQTPIEDAAFRFDLAQASGPSASGWVSTDSVNRRNRPRIVSVYKASVLNDLARYGPARIRPVGRLDSQHREPGVGIDATRRRTKADRGNSVA